MIGVSFLLILVFLLIYLPSIIETQDWLNYSSVAKLYDGETVNVIYNSKYEDGSPNQIAESIVGGQGSSINPTAFDLNIGTGEDYSTFLEDISTKLNTKGGDMAAYYIDADDLLDKAVQFVAKNPRTLQNNKEWEAFQESHPKCASKMINLLTVRVITKRHAAN